MLQLLLNRLTLQAELDKGAQLTFPPETKHIREDLSWRGAAIGPGLEDRRCVGGGLRLPPRPHETVPTDLLSFPWLDTESRSPVLPTERWSSMVSLGLWLSNRGGGVELTLIFLRVVSHSSQLWLQDRESPSSRRKARASFVLTKFPRSQQFMADFEGKLEEREGF